MVLPKEKPDGPRPPPPEPYKVRELVPPGKPLKDTGNVDAPSAPPPPEPALRCGYVIGVREDEELVFEILGSKPGIAELLGLHEIVGARLNSKMDAELGGMFSLVLSKISESSLGRK